MGVGATVRIERAGAVWTVLIDRPAVRNAVDRPTAEALADAFRAFDADDEAAVAVLSGTGGSFCAGADLGAFGTERENRLDPTGDGPMGPTRMVLSKPVIAAIEGWAVAGGLELALWCDLRVAAEDAVLGVFSRRFGVPLIDGGTVRLPRLIGRSRALDLILTGRAVDATEALAMGLVNRVVGRGAALDAATELARQLAGFPQACLRSDRAALYAAEGQSEADALRTEFVAGQRPLEAEARAGAGRFRRGAGRHGRPLDQ
ncbi:crotonase/enoyl-CoA hydratase family protein [Acidimicrobium ferrooxidans]|uniref:crotonase/enoyl-CoA hydratase family protein n=1 Tax=Acidimicrobium ferrooxidans TaxID=53635 RepID=UPI0005A2D3DB